MIFIVKICSTDNMRVMFISWRIN